MFIKTELENFNIIFNTELRNSLDLIKDTPKKLLDAIEYILFSGGKRIRPFLMYQVYNMFSDNINEIMDISIALEMIHTYSLVHDDLPAMDNDDYRRGKLTVHKKFGEDIAILTGDALLNLAFEKIALKINSSNDIKEYDKYTKSFLEISKYSGARGMIGGQVLDMELSNESINIIEMYEKKTSDLFKTAVVIGGIIGNGTEKEVDMLRNYGKNLGIAYQLKDDILDNDEDLKINKITLSTKLGIIESNKLLEKYTEEAYKNLEELKNRDTKKLIELTNLLMGRKY